MHEGQQLLRGAFLVIGSSVGEGRHGGSGAEPMLYAVLARNGGIERCTRGSSGLSGGARFKRCLRCLRSNPATQTMDVCESEVRLFRDVNSA